MSPTASPRETADPRAPYFFLPDFAPDLELELFLAAGFSETLFFAGAFAAGFFAGAGLASAFFAAGAAALFAAGLEADAGALAGADPFRLD